MTTKTMPPKRPATSEEIPDDLRAAYQVHTLAHMLYSQIAPYHGWYFQAPYAPQAAPPTAFPPLHPMAGFGPMTPSGFMAPFGEMTPLGRLPEAQPAEWGPVAAAPWGVPFSLWTR